MFSLKTEANYEIHDLRACFLLSIHIIYSWNPEMFTHYFWNLDSSSFCLGTNNILPQEAAWCISHFQKTLLFYWKYNSLRMFGRNQKASYQSRPKIWGNQSGLMFSYPSLPTPTTDLLKSGLEVLRRIMLVLKSITLLSTGIGDNSQSLQLTINLAF